MILIIAEKPSLARNIVSAIGNMKNESGYYYNDKYVVTYAFGHLFTLCDIEDYYDNVKDNKWTMDNLPCFPDKFKFNLKKNEAKQIDAGVSKQFELIKKLCNKETIDTIVNAGDADREGEVIIRLIVENALGDNKKSFKRLWLPDQTKETILEGLDTLKDESEYDNLANEGFARTFIDWLYGVNLTRYATLKTGTLLRVGRVIIPIVKAIYDRDMAIKNFTPDIYYGLESKETTNDEVVELVSREKFDKKDKNKCIDLINKYNSLEATVVDKREKEDTLSPGKLYSLSKLQNYLGKKYKMSMDKSLSITQKLYEAGYLTYPRTNSEYLATNEKGKVKNLIKIIGGLGYPVEFKDKKTIFDDKKIESHSALTPTTKIPKKENLSEDEFLVYQTVFKRFVAVFCSEDAVVLKTEIKIDLQGVEEFNLKGMIIKNPGWMKFDDRSQNDKILPNLNIGDKVNVKFELKEKETTPPKHYTIETLNNYLKNPFKDDKKEIDEDADDAEEYKAIFEGLELGTEATRTGIIDNARKSEYILLKKDVYTILPKGEYLIESLIQMNISMDKYKTSEMGKALKKVFHNEITVDDSVKLACTEIKEIFDNKVDDTGLFGEVIGKCPICNSEVAKNRYNYGCKNYKECNFKIGLTLCGKTISKDIAQKLLNHEETDKLTGFVSKNGKSFDAKLKLDKDKIIFDFN